MYGVKLGTTGMLPGIDALLLYLVYISFLVVMASNAKYAPKSAKRAIDDFFSYAHKGHRRVVSLGNFLLTFLATQLCYLIFYLVAPSWMFIPLYFTISILVSYLVALHCDRWKKHRHNGIQIGFEYPHPIGMETELGATLENSAGVVTTRISTSGSKGIYDMQVLSEPNPHVMIVGESGSGKTNLTLTFLTRAFMKFGTPFLIMDWSGSYKHTSINVNIWRVPTNLRINPFPLRGMSVERRSGIASELLQVSLGLTDLQAQKVRETLVEMYNAEEEPTIRSLHDRILEAAEKERYKEMKLQMRYITNKLRQAFDIFGYEPQEFWDNYNKTCNILDMEGLTDVEKKLVTHTIMQRIIEEFKVQGRIRLYIALDDAYQAIVNYYGKETNITKVVREGRKYGFGLLISTQLLQDLPEAIIANTSMKFILAYHEPIMLDKIHRMLTFTEVEKGILHRMPVGSCMVFDENAIQNGMPHPAYVEVDAITKHEKERLSLAIKRLNVKRLFEPPFKEAVRKTRTVEILKGQDIPSVSVYRFLIAYTKTANLTEAYKLLKQKRWVTSLTTIYGTKSKPSILERAKEAGYLDNDEKITEKAVRILDPFLMVERQGKYKGSEEHKVLMRRIIEMVEENGNYPFVMAENRLMGLEDRSSFDIGELRPQYGTKGVWDYDAITAYEAQTNAIRSEITNCIEKAREMDTDLIFVTNSGKTKGEIERLTDHLYKCIKLTLYPEFLRNN